MELLALLRAAANPDRLAILAVLRDEFHHGRPPLNVSEVARAVELDRFAASRHLGILAESGLVERLPTGKAVRHRLREEAFEAIEDWVVGVLDAVSAPVETASVYRRTAEGDI